MTQLRIKANQKRVPFGGHHFKEDGITIKGDTPEEVAETVANFRLINGRPVGNPMRDIIQYYAIHYPWMVEKDTNPQEEEQEPQEYRDWRQWISSQWGKPQDKFVSNKEAHARLAVCAKCPHNRGRPWDDGIEPREFSRKALMLRRGATIDEKYCFCDLHRADISVSSFVESPAALSRKENNKTLPADCWFKNSDGA